MSSPLPTYRSFPDHLKARFGERVHRVTVRGGFTCPNRDGTKGTGGCAFCSPEVAAAPLSQISDQKTPNGGGFTRRNPIDAHEVKKQLERGKGYISRRFKAHKFIAYFNDYTATYDEENRLRALFEAAIDPSDVVGLAIGTRPDALPENVISLLQELNERTYLWVELGLQTRNEQALQKMGRGHTAQEFAQAAKKLGDLGIRVCAHVILGLPGLDRRDDVETARFLEPLPISGVKIHNLHIVKGSRWASSYKKGEISVPSLEEHVIRTISFLEHISPQIIVHRLVSSAPKNALLAPPWCLEKNKAIDTIRNQMKRLGTWQGKNLNAQQKEVSLKLEDAVKGD